MYSVSASQESGNGDSEDTRVSRKPGKHCHFLCYIPIVADGNNRKKILSL